MNINPDDPKWTAYVLGEMDEGARAALSSELESSVEAREFVEELRLAATFMKERVAAETGFGLTPEQRTMVRAAAPGRRKYRLATPVWAAGLAAASLLVAVAFLPAVLRTNEAPKIAALNTEPAASATATVLENALQQSQQPPAADVRQQAPRKAAKDQAATPRSHAGLPDVPVEGRDFADLVSLSGQSGQQGQQRQQSQASQPGQEGQVGGQGQQGEQDRFAAEFSKAAGAGGGAGIGNAGDAATPSAPRGALAGILGGLRNQAKLAAVPAAAPPPPRASVMPRVATDSSSAQPQPTIGYDQITDSPFVAVTQQPLATFSSNVDTASYANVRKFLSQNMLPPKDAVRIEELINYFSYDYSEPSRQNPITANTEEAAAPWNPQHRLVRIGIKARDIQSQATLMTIAKEVSIQVEFNPAQVDAYRLIGYENRALRAQAFDTDQKDAGDMGAGHTVTALFEVVPRGVEVNVNAPVSNEMLNLKIRYKDPAGGENKLLSFPLVDRGGTFASASADFRFAAAVAGFGMILRDSPYKGAANIEWVIATAANSRGPDTNGYRREFVALAQRAAQIRGR